MLLFVVFASVLAAAAFAGCPQGYHYYEEDTTCLKSHLDPKSFNDARKTCQSEGGDLAQIRDAAKDSFIGAFHLGWYWTGIWDSDHNRRFAYIDGTPLGSYHPWRRGEPNNYRGREYCAMIFGTTNRNSGQWNDGDCNGRLTFVCEIRLCPRSYTYYQPEHTCLRFDTRRKSFNIARKLCQNEGGDLALVKDDIKSNFIGGMETNWYWMGLTDPNKDRQFTYLDGSPMEGYHPWRRGEPNNSGGREFCVMVIGSSNRDKGQWNDGYCNDPAPFVCEVRVCPEGYTYYQIENTCLKAFDQRKSFDEARSQCQSEDGDLAQVHDAAKSTFIGGLTTHWYWMGLWDSEHNRQFSYIDGTPLGGYRPWRRGEPNNWGGREFCVMVIGSTNRDKGQWNDGYCNDPAPFVCERKRK